MRTTFANTKAVAMPRINAVALLAALSSIAHALEPRGVSELRGGVMLVPFEGLGRNSGPAVCDGFVDETRTCSIRGVCKWYECADASMCTTDATCIRLPSAQHAGTAACQRQCTRLGRIGACSYDEVSGKCAFMVNAVNRFAEADGTSWCADQSKPCASAGWRCASCELKPEPVQLRGCRCDLTADSAFSCKVEGHMCAWNHDNHSPLPLVGGADNARHWRGMKSGNNCTGSSTHHTIRATHPSVAQRGGNEAGPGAPARQHMCRMLSLTKCACCECITQSV